MARWPLELTAAPVDLLPQRSERDSGSASSSFMKRCSRMPTAAAHVAFALSLGAHNSAATDAARCPSPWRARPVDLAAAACKVGKAGKVDGPFSN